MSKLDDVVENCARNGSRDGYIVRLEIAKSKQEIKALMLELIDTRIKDAVKRSEDAALFQLGDLREEVVDL